MVSTVSLVSQAPLVSLTSSIARGRCRRHCPGQNGDTGAVARRCRRGSTWSPIRHTRRRPGGACRRSEASASLTNRFCTHVIQATIEDVPRLWRHGPLAPEAIHPVATVKPWPTNAPASTASIDLEIGQRQTSIAIDDASVAVARASTSKRFRRRRLRRHVASPTTRGGLRPRAPHWTTTPGMSTAMPMGNAESATLDRRFGPINAPSSHGFSGPSQAIFEGNPC